MKIRNEAKRQRQSHGENDMIKEAGDDPKANGPFLSGSEAPTPVTMSSSLMTSEFQTLGLHPPSEELKNIPDGELLKRARASFLEAFKWLDVVEARRVADVASAAEKAREHEKTMKSLEKLKSDHKALEIANRDLTSSVNNLTEQNTSLLLLNKDLEAKHHDANSQHTEAVKALEKATRESDCLNTAFKKKLSELYSADFEKEVKIRALEAASKDMNLQLKNISCDNTWLLKEGVPFCFRSLLGSKEFGHLITQFQLGAIEYGLHKGCLEMKKKYSGAVPDVSCVYSYPRARETVMERYLALVSHEFPLLVSLKSGDTTVETLKSLVEASRKDCHVESGECSRVFA